MSRPSLPFAVNDISTLARSLGRELAAGTGEPLGHVRLLNLLARSAGFRNFQHYRAEIAARERLDAPPVAAPEVDHRRIEQVVRHFDAAGRLVRWPSKESHTKLALWVLWSRIPAGAVLTELEMNRLLATWHLFGDHAILRRSLVGYRLVSRTVDCREYRRIEQPPPAEALLLIRRFGRARTD